VACLKDADCPNPKAQSCNTTTKTCVLKTGYCLQSADCAAYTPRTLCHPTYFYCVQCATAQQCPSWQICFTDTASCNNDPQCYAKIHTCIDNPAGCSSDAQCPTGKHCQISSRKCLECTLDAHCPTGKRCDPLAFTCRDATTFCQKDADCTTPKKCLLTGQACVDCLANTDCKTGEWCTTTHQCRSQSACTEHSDCGVTQICDAANKICIGCLSDQNCPWDQVCDTTTKKCVTCTLDSHCPAYSGQVCIDGVCQAGCRTSSSCSRTTPYCKIPVGVQTGSCVQCLSAGLEQCPAGEECDVATGKCLPKTSTACASPGDCALGSYCDLAQKKCVLGCLSDRDCPSKAPRCDTTAKSCMICVNDGHCSTGKICEKNQCIDGCRSSRDCDTRSPSCDTTASVCYRPCATESDCKVSYSTSKCDVTAGRCVGCVVDADCYTPQTCQNQKCAYISCTQDADCPAKTVCQTSGKICVAGCRQDSDCTTAGQICVSQQCRSGCRSDATCTSTTGYKYCVNTTCVQCRQDSDCAYGSRCTQGYCSKGCDVSGGDAYCQMLYGRLGQNRCHFASGRCVQCVGNYHCTVGQVCVKYICVEDRLATLCKTCQSDADCGGNLCIGYPCAQTPKEKACGAACDAKTPCPEGYRCATLSPAGKPIKQCVPLLFDDRCNGKFGGSCSGVLSFRKACMGSGSSDPASCGLPDIYDAYCPMMTGSCTTFCRTSSDCPANFECKSCDTIGPTGSGFNECSFLYTTQKWSVCVYKQTQIP
jgi:hypothetical protein